ncbi:MAG: hypothetical protein QME63_07155 [Actinomycetota bacterium]|nr:hypothetical protein [Actinomycetota bacterium]
MRRLLFGLVILIILGQIPQVSAQFKEEREGVNAAVKKVNAAYNTAINAYNKVQQDAKEIQTKLIKFKADVDAGLAYKDRVLDQASEYYGKAEELAGEVKDAVGAPEASLVPDNKSVQAKQVANK